MLLLGAVSVFLLLGPLAQARRRELLREVSQFFQAIAVQQPHRHLPLLG